jgi:rod shape-determining protein MreC
LFGFLRNRYFVVVAIILVLLSVTVNFTKQQSRALTGLERTVRDFLLPIERPIMKITRAGQTLVRDVASLKELKKENQRLSDRLAYLESENENLEEDRRENIRLSSLLSLKQSIPHEVVAARVIARDPSNWTSSIVLDKGRRDGLKANMPVVAPGGLVGRVTSVSERTSSVLLILDSRSAVSALIQRSRDIVIVEGSAEKVGYTVLKPLNARLLGGTEQWTSQVTLKLGDMVISSGLGGVFPKGLTIGRVVSIGKGRYGVSKSAVVKPEVDFGRLEEVLVITNAGEVPEDAAMTPADGETR